MRVTCAFREQCAPGRRPDCSRCCQCRSPNSKGKNRLEKCVRNCFMLFPTDSSSTLIHYFLFVSFSFVCHAVFFFFRTMLQLQEVRAWVSMKDTLQGSSENSFLFQKVYFDTIQRISTVTKLLLLIYSSIVESPGSYSVEIMTGDMTSSYTRGVGMHQ